MPETPLHTRIQDQHLGIETDYSGAFRIESTGQKIVTLRSDKQEKPRPCRRRPASQAYEQLSSFGAVGSRSAQGSARMGGAGGVPGAGRQGSGNAGQEGGAGGAPGQEAERPSSGEMVPPILNADGDSAFPDGFEPRYAGQHRTVDSC